MRDEDRILAKLDRIEETNRETLVAITQLMEQAKDIPDHETRLRLLERWKYGLPVAGLTAVLSACLSAYATTRGGS